MQDRENTLKEWLNTVLEHSDYQLTLLAGDASFRRYFRLNINGLSHVVMDAPPTKEDIAPFIQINKTLEKTPVLVPEILAVNKDHGFLLLADLGDELLLKHLNSKTVDYYYKKAIDSINHMQQCPIQDPLLPEFDQEFMLKEMNLCPEWFLKSYLQLQLSADEQHVIETSMAWIAQEVAKQPQVFIHRDYHSRNLIVFQDQLGVIDFQDAMRGPLTYDLVSLLKDCYISWSRDQILQWLAYFYQTNALAQRDTFDNFVKAFDLCGIQRHLKVLGIFCRLYLRDQKPGYLKDLPLTLNYVLETAETYPELTPLFHLFQKRVLLP